jgi:S-sulfo-L-cysteine synthase (O-acetyl-L-serine-dependent)
MRAATDRQSQRDTTVLDLIGNTPLLRLKRFETGLQNVELYGKAEWFNPGGSVKDRPAANMVKEGLRSGALRPGKTLLDATSGNTGIAYAMIGACSGFSVRLCVPSNVTIERKRLLHAYGADLIFTDPMDGSDGAIREARRQVAANPDRYFYPDQYNNDANWRAHYETTAPEILAQTEGRITHFVAGLGTSGTFVGTGRRLREANPAIKLISFQPDSPLHGLEGLKHMDSAIVPGIYDPSLADEDVPANTEDAYTMVRRLAREEGLLVGISGGAALAVALKVARQLRNAVIVTIFPDSADKYMSERFWQLPVQGSPSAGTASN